MGWTPRLNERQNGFNGVKLMIAHWRLKTDGKAEDPTSGRETQGARSKNFTCIEHPCSKTGFSAGTHRGEAL